MVDGREVQHLHLKCGICREFSRPPTGACPRALVRLWLRTCRYPGENAMTEPKGTRQRSKSRRAAVLGLLLLFAAPSAYSYSVLTHEAIIDSTWDSAIKPLLLKRFPAATADELTQAH